MLSGRRVIPGRRSGLTLFEVLITLLLVAALGALVVPAVSARLDRAEVTAVVDNLNNVRSAIVAYRQDVGRYPSQLMQLQKRPGVDGSPTTDICAAALPAANIARWTGPYLSNPLGTGGIEIGKSVVLQNVLDRNTTSGEYIRVIILGLSTQSGNDVDLTFDGGDVPSTAGSVSLVPASNPPQYRFWIAITGC